jgi:hypothetical protein
VALQMSPYVILRQRSIASHNECLDRFAKDLVGNSNYRHFHDVGNGNNVLFNLLCADAIAAGFDYLASATGRKMRSLLILVTEIASEIITMA